ncbi:MAG: hypothetical protein R3E96_04345 [Planctomycetota bacterium]
MKPTLFTTLLFSVAVATAWAQDGQDPVGPQAPRLTTTQSALVVGSPVVIYTNVPGYTQSMVPGLGVAFKPGTGTTNFDRVYGSPNGNWILTALADLATTDDECILVGNAVVMQEGQPAPWVPGETCGTIDQRVEINDAGDWVFATNTSGTVNDDYIVKNSGGVWTIEAQEGSPIAALPGNTWDDLLDSPMLLADGTVGAQGDGIDGTVTTTEDEILTLGSVLLLQEGVTIPPGQAAGGVEFIENLDQENNWASEDGAHWMISGDLTGDTNFDDVVIVDGAVVLQEGYVIPGSSFVDPIDLSGIVEVSMDAAGNWFARGNNDVTEDDWVVRNGVVIAQVDTPVITGSTELWDDTPYADCFFLHVGNSQGDWVIGGVTDNADPLLNGLIVKNGTEIVAREGDPVDMDGNGLFDNDAFLSTFGNDDAFLADDGTLYLVVTVKDSTGATTGQVFISIDTAGGSPLTTFCDPMDNNSTGLPTVLSGQLRQWHWRGLALGGDPSPPTQFGYFLIGTGANDPGIVISNGRLCLDTTGGNVFGRYNVGGGG